MEMICVTRWCDDCSCVFGVFSDRRQQLLARSLHGAHIPPDHGVLQPVHLHERPESGGRRAGPRHQAAGGRAAGGKGGGGLEKPPQRPLCVARAGWL